EEALPRRRVEEEARHRDRGAAAARDRRRRFETPRYRPEPRAGAIVGRCLELELRDARDRGERLAAEAEAPDADEVGGVADLGGGVPLEREARVVGLHAAAVIGDTDAREAAVIDRDLDARGAGVERVLDELLHDAGGALDDLPRRDLVDD